MKDAHLTQEDLRAVLEDRDDARNRLLLHHLAVCPDCNAVGGDVLEAYEAGDVTIDLYTLDVDLVRSRRAAPGLWQELRPQPFDRQQDLVREDPRFRIWGLCELLCAESRACMAAEPERARELAELAALIGSLLTEWQPAEQHWHDELYAYAIAHVANARRILGDLAGAEALFVRADALWIPAEKDVGNVLGFSPWYLTFKALLRRAQRRLPEALDLFEEARNANPDPALCARIHIETAWTLEEAGRAGEAVTLLSAARASGHPAGRDELLLAQHHLDLLCRAGAFIEAEGAMVDVEHLAARHGTDVDTLRAKWIKARIAGGLGRPEEAARLLETVRKELGRRGLRQDEATASLELALLYVGQGREEDAAGAVRRTLELLSGATLPPESRTALRVLSEAVDTEKLTAALLSQALDVLRKGGNYYCE
jgi:tetratricopeptide (TPR) repeat protein